MASVSFDNVYSLSNISAYQGLGNILTLPQRDIDERFLTVEQEVETRWEALTKEISFPKYQMGQDKEVLVKEFQHFNALRKKLHFDIKTVPNQALPDFKLAQNILINHRYRQPFCVTFEHSKADDSYNCTCITVGEKKFFALDGPTAENVEYFYRLLSNWNVNNLVCLVGESENGIPKCFPYWQDKVIEKGGLSFFCLPLEGKHEAPQTSWDKKSLHYTSVPAWPDHRAFDVKLLINEVHKARTQHHTGEITAIHCSAGVGRTGTFLALICLLDQIDTQILSGIHPSDLNINIAELFLKLNFYRPWMVSTESQYLSLYEVLDYYISEIITKSNKVQAL